MFEERNIAICVGCSLCVCSGEKPGIESCTCRRYSISISQAAARNECEKFSGATNCTNCGADWHTIDQCPIRAGEPKFQNDGCCGGGPVVRRYTGTIGGKR